MAEGKVLKVPFPETGSMSKVEDLVQRDCDIVISIAPQSFA